MPLPIWPAPITPILRMACDIMSVHYTPCAVRPSGKPAKRRTPFLRRTGATFHPQTRACSPCLALDLGEFGVEFGQRLIEIGNQPVIGDLEDRGFLVLVDGDDDF